MTRSFTTEELSRALRAELPYVDDDVVPVTLAQVARTAPAPAPRTGISRGLKVGAVAASIVVTVFGAAHASGLWLGPSEPAISPPSDRRVEDPVDRLPDTDIPRRQSGRSDQDRGSSVPGSGPSGNGLLPSSTKDEAHGPDDGTEPAPSSVPGSPGGSEDQDHDNDGPGGSEDQDHDNDGPEDSEAPDDSDGPADSEAPDDSDGPDDNDGPEDSDGPDVEIGERDRAADESETVDDLERDD